jgi:hypothetical protein
MESSTAFPNYRVNKAVIASEAKQSNYHTEITARLLRRPATAGLLAMTLLFHPYLGIVLLDIISSNTICTNTDTIYKRLE